MAGLTCLAGTELDLPNLLLFAKGLVEIQDLDCRILGDDFRIAGVQVLESLDPCLERDKLSLRAKMPFECLEQRRPSRGMRVDEIEERSSLLFQRSRKG